MRFLLMLNSVKRRVIPSGASTLLQAASSRLVEFVRALVFSHHAGGPDFRAAGAVLALQRGLVQPPIGRVGDGSGRREGHDREEGETTQGFSMRSPRLRKRTIEGVDQGTSSTTRYR
jgi:hypothetical protein